MDTPLRSILLFAYKFPPYREVGAQRWTLLTRYLAQLGHSIDVLTVDWDPALYPQPAGEKPWPDNVTIHRVPSGYPHNWVRRPRNTRIGRIVRNRITMGLHKTIFWDDEAQHWGHQLVPYTTDLLARKKIDTLVATGAPFQTMRWATVIQKSHNIPLVLDFRDPWFYEPARHLTDQTRRGRAIKRWESEAIGAASAVVSIAKGMDAEFRQHYPQAARFEVIHNGYDPAAIPVSAPMPPSATFVYIGSINTGREEPADAFLRAVAYRNAHGGSVTVRLVGAINPRMLGPWQAYVEAGWLHIHGQVSQAQAFAYVRQSRYALYFGTEDLPYALSTKIYEYAALRVPVFAVHYGGEIAQLIQQHSLGVSANLRASSLDSAIDQALATDTTAWKYSIEAFAYPALASKYSHLLQSL